MARIALILACLAIMANPIGNRKAWARKEARPGVNPTADFHGPLDKLMITNFSKAHGIKAFNVDGEGEIGSYLPNPDFSYQSRDDTLFLPDGWIIGSSHQYGSSEEIYYSTSVTQSGGRSLLFRNTSSISVDSIYVQTDDFVPVAANTVLSMASKYYSDGGAAISSALVVQANFYNSSKTFVSGQTITISNPTGSSWKDTPPLYFITPSTARYFRVFITKQIAGTDFNLYIDRVDVKRCMNQAYVYQNSPQSINSGSITTVDFDTTSFDLLTGFDNTNNYIDLKTPGIYLVDFGARINSLGAGKKWQVYLYGSNDASSWTPISFDETFNATAGAVNVSAGRSCIVPWINNSNARNYRYVKVQVFHDHGSALNTVNGNYLTYLHITQLERTI